MEWLIIVGLAAWVFRLSQRTSELERKIKSQAPAEHAPPATAKPASIAAPAPSPIPPVRPAAPAPRPQPHAAPSAAHAQAQSTPVSNTRSSPAEPIGVAEAATASAAPVAPHSPQQTWRAPPTPPPPPRPPRPPRERNIERWLSENGLAWLGGGALALGGIFLVAYAAQRGVFTPIMRLCAALVLGALLICASEWVRRASRTGKLSHPLVAALLAGAGAATFYGTIWGAHGLYHYIDWSSAACALAAVVILLIGLALLHGEAIGILAIVAGLLAPLLTNKGAWPADALSLYVIGVTMTGYALAGFRRWAWVAGASLAGAYVWYAISFSDGETWRAMSLLGVTALGASALAFARPKGGAQNAEDASWTSTLQLLPTLAIAASSVLMLAQWSLSLNSAAATIMAPAMGAIGLVIIAALAVRAQIASPLVLAGAISTLVFGFALHWQRRFGFIASDFDAWAMTATAIVALSGFGGSLRDKSQSQPIAQGAGAFGACLLLLFAAYSPPAWPSATLWLIFLVSGLLMYIAAELCGRVIATPRRETSQNLWSIAGSGILLLAIHIAVPDEFMPLAFSAAALAFTLVQRWRGWSALSGAAITAAALALARAVAPGFFGAVFDGSLSIWFSLWVLLGGALLLLAASRVFLKRETISAASETLSTGAVILTVIAAFLTAHWLATGESHTPLSDFTEYSLYALVLTIAGFCVMPRGAGPLGWLARSRGHIMLLFGLIFSLVELALVLNPWWGAAPAIIMGPSLFNEMALAFAAPGLIALLTAGRLYARDRSVARFYAIFGALFIAIWLSLEIRHAFHGAMMSDGGIGLLEGNAYGLAALGLALLETGIARRRYTPNANAARPLSADMHAASGSFSLTGLLIALWMIGLCYNPFWGLLETQAGSALEAIASIGAPLIAAAFAYVLARLNPPLSSARSLSVFSALSFALITGVLFIRHLNHGADMHGAYGLIGIEGLWYGLWPMAFTTFCGWMLTHHFVSAVRGSVAATARQIASVSIWIALGFATFSLCVLFAPWWGLHSAQASTTLAAFIGLALYLLAAWLSTASAKLPLAKEHALYVEIAALACVLDLFVTVTLIVRRLFRGADMAPALREASLETWTYSAIWALFSAIVLWIGTAKQSAILRWAGLCLLLVTTAKVFLIDMARLDGVIRAASFLGLGGILVLVALAVRKNSQRDNAKK